MSFQRLEMKLAPLSDVTREGQPNKLTQWVRKPVAASDEEQVFNGIA